MLNLGVTENIVEEAALAWFEELKWPILYGLETAAGDHQ